MLRQRLNWLVSLRKLNNNVIPANKPAGANPFSLDDFEFSPMKVLLDDGPHEPLFTPIVEPVQQPQQPVAPQQQYQQQQQQYQTATASLRRSRSISSHNSRLRRSHNISSRNNRLRHSSNISSRNNRLRRSSSISSHNSQLRHNRRIPCFIRC